MSFTIAHTTHTYPRIDYKKIKNDVMGQAYDLSLVFVGDKKSRALNKHYRNKTYIPNVLAFPLTEGSGEVYINPHQVEKEAQKRARSEKSCAALLFIHGLLHLKGCRHGAKMDKAETRYMKRHGFA